ncbi:MAG: response regulator transcription factor [Elusimicrobiota bacterium]|nr:response regulator transcription factor [Elusimicrobiota bacterium]
MMKKIIVELIKITLEKEGYKVHTAKSADEALQTIERNSPQLILLDLKLPGVFGQDLCRILKSKEEAQGIPIIMVTGRYVKPEERAAGIELGADDYIIKPFYSGELLARARAVLRRGEYKMGQKTLKVYGSSSSGDLIVDLQEHTVKIGKRFIHLTPKEFDLLVVLVSKKNKLLTRDFLLESVWGMEYFGTPRTVDMHIAKLRHKLSLPFNKKIQTVETLGYKFVD